MAWRRFRKKKDMPSGLWVKCPSCEATLFNKELARNLQCCTDCGHHFPVSARDRIAMTVDHESFEERDPDLYAVDRLGFVDKEPYSEKLRRTIEKTGQADAAVYGTATIEGKPVVMAVLDFTFIGGSMGAVVGEKVTRAVELATELNLPCIVISASGGARMHEGVLSLMQMAKTSAAIQRHDAAGGLYVSVLTNPTTGGVMASFAALGDVIIAEPGALIGFAGPRVIRETLRQNLPDGFQTSEFLKEHGFLDQIVPRSEMRATLSRLLDYLWRYESDRVLGDSDWSPPRYGVEEAEEAATDAEAPAEKGAATTNPSAADETSEPPAEAEESVS